MRERAGRKGLSLSAALLLTILLTAGLLLAGCKNVRSPEVVKIGLIAPFEGPSRPLGYGVLDAVKLRINQWNESDAPFKVELVALNDDSDPELAAQLPAQLAQDPDIRVILGPPQGHTAAAAQMALARTGIPTILLAPVKGVVGVDILPFAGIERDYRQVFHLESGETPAAWTPPITRPVIWFGDPLTLAETYTTQPGMIVAIGPVAEEEVMKAWVPGLTDHLPWAAPAPINLPEDFPSEYEAVAGRPPTRAAALAYAATEYAIAIIAATPGRIPDVSQLQAIPTPPITLMNEHLMQ